MNKTRIPILHLTLCSLALALSAFLLGAAQVNAQCTELASGLLTPSGTALTNQGNLLVSETGVLPNPPINFGRISIIDPVSGHRRTLLDGLPSAMADVPEPSGPSGIFMRGRTLYVAIGVGDVGRPGPFPGTVMPNPLGASSPIFSSILAIHFSAAMERTTQGFTLTAAQQQALANGETVTFSNGGRDKMTVRMVADFPNFVPFPLPTFAGNIQVSNPFHLVAVEDNLYVTDGGRNRVWQVDLLTGAVSTLVTFPDIPNPLFGIVPAGGPFLQAVPTGIAYANGRLYVTLFRGVPFPPNTSTVEEIDPLSGSDTPFITGLKTAIDVIPVEENGGTNYLVLQHASLGPFFGSPGLVLRFTNPAGPPAVLANCLTRPVSMARDPKTGTLYISELAGRVVRVLAPALHSNAEGF
ncbi:MAG: ScyD/ScyE family protein [Chthoniobacterales bacterium]